MSVNHAINEVVRTAFAFLVSSHRFRLVEERENYFRLENDRVVVVLVYDRQRSYEMSVALGLKGDAQPLFDLPEVLRSRGVAAEQQPAGYQTASDDVMRRLVAQMSRVLEQHGAALLSGDSLAWRELNALRDAECLDYAQRRDLGFARSKADAAWKKKDFPGVVAALSPLQALLSPVELKRLEYAGKKIRQSS